MSAAPGLSRLAGVGKPAEAGGKGFGINWLIEKGHRTPAAWVVAPGPVPDLAAVLQPERSYAVRSSADVEDGVAASFAGQFTTVLDVSGVDAVKRAIEKVRSSSATSTVRSYAERIGGDATITMYVIVQEMIEPEVSGVAFTRNPITGLDEVVMEAVAGRGDQLLSDGITPHRWVRRWGAWVESPEDPPLPDHVAVALADAAKSMAEEYGRPADLEWVWDGTNLWWMQIRPIVGIEDVGIYSNRISKEVMPGLIKPLVWSVNVPVVNGAWIELFTQAIGPNDLDAGDLAKAFAYRSYFNMGAIGDIFELMGMPRDSLESLIGLPPGPEQPKFRPSRRTMMMTPRLFAFALLRSRYARKSASTAEDLMTRFGTYDVDVTGLSDKELFVAVDSLMAVATQAAYANIVVPLLANLYNTLLRKRMGKYGLDLAEVDISLGKESEFDPNPHLDRLAYVIEEYGPESDEAKELLDAFLDRFGHLSDSGNDFSVAPWREQPSLVAEMATVRGAAKRAPLFEWDDAVAPLGTSQRYRLDRLRVRAAAYQHRREQISSMYTYGYGLLRNYFMELGRRLVAKDLLRSPEEIMYLELDQVREAMSGGMPRKAVRRTVDRHLAEMERVADIDMPELIYGDDFIATAPSAAEGTLCGVATSRGHHRGRLRVVSGLADFGKVEHGDVVAIPFSDAGWTGLFAKAGAVVAESGGMLSHSSIVAREYGIPCVVSVRGAMRLEDGVTVTVDGYRGQIVVG